MAHICSCPRPVGDRNWLPRLGEWGFFGVYSLIAIVTVVPLCMYYGAHKHTGPQLWVTLLPYLIARDVNVLLMGLAFVLFVSGLAALTPSSILANTPRPRRMVLPGSPATQCLPRSFCLVWRTA